MDWFVLSVFKTRDHWIPGFVRPGTHRFRIADPTYSHDRSRARAGLRDWRDYFLQVLRIWPTALWSRQPIGLITVFPQLALIVGVLKRMTFSRRPAIAWIFNFGRTHEGFQGHVARFGYRGIDRFAVHSRHEIDVYSRWLRLPSARFVFVPLSVLETPITEVEDEDDPFILSMGTPKRDYALFLRVLTGAPYRALIVAAPHALEGLEIPPNVEIRSGLSEVECRQLCQRARLSVVPLRDLDTAAGQVTVVEAMMSGRAVIATRSVGTVDYIDHGRDGMLVAAGDAAAMRSAIDDLWLDRGKRIRMGRSARQTALDHYTFGAVAQHMERLMDELIDDRCAARTSAQGSRPGGDPDTAT